MERAKCTRQPQKPEEKNTKPSKSITAETASPVVYYITADQQMTNTTDGLLYCTVVPSTKSLLNQYWHSDRGCLFGVSRLEGGWGGGAFCLGPPFRRKHKHAGPIKRTSWEEITYRSKCKGLTASRTSHRGGWNPHQRNPSIPYNTSKLQQRTTNTTLNPNTTY